ncbi:hypothetical protein AaE_003395 [Aphanomyces astaci]|uniref:Uncharacterized protein n=1 Tax=Aphanomyces astaci TaxID=112090 RepID=A0A6A5AL69_APHAT|nr:hypothetical protein AaE_003395 [Aphanomyces astaci]
MSTDRMNQRVSQLKATSYTKLLNANTNGRYDSEEETVLPDDVVDSKLNVLDSNVDIPSSPPFAWTQLGSEQHTVSSAPHSNDDGKSAFMEASNVDVALVAEDPNTSLHGNEVDAIEDDEQDEVMEGDVSSGVHHAWSVMRGLCTHLSHAEVGAINRGLPLHGPPAAAPTTAANALKTRFRWPVRMQNLLRTSFEMSPSPIDVTLDDNADNDDVAGLNHPDDASCLPALPEPLCDAVTSEFRRLRPLPAFPPSHELPSKLSHIVRDAAVFADVLMEMLLVRNAAALQGHEQHYSSSAWLVLPPS